jgi:hypothetical protein
MRTSGIWFRDMDRTDDQNYKAFVNVIENGACVTHSGAREVQGNS